MTKIADFLWELMWAGVSITGIAACLITLLAMVEFVRNGGCMFS